VRRHEDEGGQEMEMVGILLDIVHPCSAHPGVLVKLGMQIVTHPGVNFRFV